MLDVYLWGKVERISPEAPVPVVAVENKEERPGGAANVALNVKELGAIPILCSVIGKDESGKSLLHLLKKSKMRSNGVVISSKRITSVKTRVLSKSHQLIRYDSEIISDLNEEDEKKLLTSIKSIITREKPDALIFEDYNKGVITASAIQKIIAWCCEKGILTAVDPKKKNFFAYKNADVFKPNLREVREAFNEEIRSVNEEVLNTIHEELRKNLQHKITLITLSEKGIYFNDGKNSGIMPAREHDVSDVSGAGDTVIATAVLALAAGMPLKEVVTLANVAGGLVCEHVGVVPVTKEMLRQEIS
jgi:rfaE bifunctional protein kinase chain/domain